MRYTTPLRLIGLVACAAIAAPAMGVTPEVGVAGGEKVLWLWVRGLDEESPDLMRFLFRPSEPVGGTWLTHRGPMVSGRVAAAAVRDEDLHVVFSDGTHRVFKPVPILFARDVGATSVSERNLPGRASPMAMTTDASRGTLVALVDGRTALDLLAEPSANGRPASSASGGADRSPSKEVKSDSTGLDMSALPASMKCAVVAFKDGVWRFDRPGPDGFDGESRPLALLAENGSIQLLCRQGPRKPPVLFTSEDAVSGWDAGVALHGRGHAVDGTGGWKNGSPVLAVGDDIDGTTSVTLWHRAEGEWRAGGMLLDALDRPLALSAPWAMGVWGERLALLRMGAEGDAELGAWRLDDATSVEPFTRVLARGESSGTGVSPALGLILQYVVLGAILAGVLAWRRERVFLIAPLRADQVPARLTRRLAAFVVDVVILSPAWAPVFYLLIQAGTPEEFSAVGQLIVAPPTMNSPVYWVGAAFGALFGLYSGLFEATLGHTPGKRLAGCFVVAESGEPCHAMSIFLRNLLRVAEFHFTPLLLLTVLTPGRQRLGDMLGRTVVVELASGQPVGKSAALDSPDEAD